MPFLDEFGVIVAAAAAYSALLIWIIVRSHAAEVERERAWEAVRADLGQSGKRIAARAVRPRRVGFVWHFQRVPAHVRFEAAAKEAGAEWLTPLVRMDEPAFWRIEAVAGDWRGLRAAYVAFFPARKGLVAVVAPSGEVVTEEAPPLGEHPPEDLAARLDALSARVSRT
jgi:hypothetical protein